MSGASVRYGFPPHHSPPRIRLHPLLTPQPSPLSPLLGSQSSPWDELKHKNKLSSAPGPQDSQKGNENISSFTSILVKLGSEQEF